MPGQKWKVKNALKVPPLVRARDLKFWHNVHHPLCVMCHIRGGTFTMHLWLFISARAFLYGPIHEDAGTTFLFIKMLCLTPATRHLKFVNISPFSKYYGRYGNFYLLLCLAIGGGGNYSKLFLRRLVLFAFCHTKPPYLFLFSPKTLFDPPYLGVKDLDFYRNNAIMINFCFCHTWL